MWRNKLVITCITKYEISDKHNEHEPPCRRNAMIGNGGGSVDDRMESIWQMLRRRRPE